MSQCPCIGALVLSLMCVANLCTACGGSTATAEGRAGASGSAGVGADSSSGSGGGGRILDDASMSDSGGACPSSAPTIGTACTPGLECSYERICCGDYICGSDGTWRHVVAACTCIVPQPDAALDAVADATRDSGSLQCGSETCLPNQVCVHPATNACGPAPLCLPIDAGFGDCPDGSTWTSYCVGSPQGGCVETPPTLPPYCADAPPSCGNTPSCECLPSDICGASTDAIICEDVRGRDVNCLCIAP